MDHFIKNCRVRSHRVVPCDTAKWSDLVVKFDGLRVGAESEDDIFDVHAGEYVQLDCGPVLGDLHDSRIATLSIRRLETGDEMVVALDVRPPPVTEAPRRVVEFTQHLGGRAGLTPLVLDLFGRQMPAVTYSITLRVPRASHRCDWIPSTLSAKETTALGDLGERVHREAVGYRFDAGTSGLNELMLLYLHDEQEYLVDVTATSAFKLGESRWLPLADDIAELVTQRFFEVAR